MFDPILWVLWLVPFFVVVVIAASAVYRRVAGKPVLFSTLPTATFLERSASGHINDMILDVLGGANGCLVVGVVGDRFIVRPRFPFTLMFLPEMYRLEHDIRISDVVRVELGQFLWKRKLVVTFRDNRGRTRGITLYLRDPDRLAALLRAGSEAQGA